LFSIRLLLPAIRAAALRAKPSELALPTAPYRSVIYSQSVISKNEEKNKLGFFFGNQKTQVLNDSSVGNQGTVQK
jgi:hypothetical protein